MTGPKISSREHSALSGTPVSTVGATKYPGPGIAGSAEGGADSLLVVDDQDLSAHCVFSGVVLYSVT